MGSIGSYATEYFVATFSGYLEGSIPADMGVLQGAFLHLIAAGAGQATQTYAVEVMNSANGEASNVHTHGADYTWTIIPNRIFVADLTALFSAAWMSPGDAYGIKITNPEGSTLALHLLGSRLIYRIKYPLQGKLGIVREKFYTCQRLDLL